MKKKLKVIAGCPTYDGTRYNGSALMDLQAAGVRVMDVRMSLLGRAFNEAYCFALNQRAFGATHFLMLHADIVPHTPNWVAELLTRQVRTKAGVLSAVMPIKTRHGLTSTAIESGDVWNPTRLHRDDVAKKPDTWTEDGLLVNTGLMVVDLKAPWADKVHFEINDRIRQDDEGKWIAETQPEDWNFSRMVREHGGSVYATHGVQAYHFGTEVW